jgi:hypothetical protein
MQINKGCFVPMNETALFFSPSHGVTLSARDFLLRKETNQSKAGEDRDSFFSAKQENSIDVSITAPGYCVWTEFGITS